MLLISCTSSHRLFSRILHKIKWRGVVLLLAGLYCAMVGTYPVRANHDAPADQMPALKGPAVEFVPGELLVRFRADSPVVAAKTNAPTTLTARGAVGRQLNVTVERFTGDELLEGLRLVRVPAADMSATIAALNERADVLYAEPNFIRRKQVVPNDPSFPQQWWLKNTGQVSSGQFLNANVNADLAWDMTTGSRNIVVGVIDDGIYIAHGDLSANIWHNPGEVLGNNIDDDHNGYIDDDTGYDFYHNSPAPFISSEHGPHVAGIIGATGNNGLGVSGMNWQVSLMSLRIFGNDDEEPTSSRIIIAAYAYAKQMRDLWLSSGGQRGANLRVLNNSYGGYGSSHAEYEAISALNDSGVLFVAAAGNYTRNNDIFPIYPAGYDLPNVISVAASDYDDTLARFTNVGARTVTLSAPGTQILSTIPGGYGQLSGTSMASPIVAGTAALVCALDPGISVRHLRAAVIFNGDEVPAQLGKTLTGRRINAYGAVRAAAEHDTTPPAPVGDAHILAQQGRAVSLVWIAPGDDDLVGRASLEELRFAETELTTDEQVAVATPLLGDQLGEPRPAVAGTWQSTTVQVPFQHRTGFIAIRAPDNLGNTSQIVNLPVAIADPIANPYAVTESDNAVLSTGGDGVLGGDDAIREGYPLPFTFPFFGHSVEYITLSTNGAMYFPVPPKFLAPPVTGSGEALDANSSITALQTNRMIAGQWDDLQGSIVAVQPDPDRIIFRWECLSFNRTAPDGTPRGEQPVRFEIELRRDGTIQMRYAASNPLLSPVVGISDGSPDAYLVASHTAEFASGQTKDLTNARTITFSPRFTPAAPTADLAVSFFSLAVEPVPNDGQNVTADPVAVSPGERIDYTLVVNDLGPDSANDVVLTYPLPPHTTFVSCDYPTQGTCTGPPPGTNGTVTVNFGRTGDLYYRFQQSVKIAVKVDGDAPPGTQINSTVTVTGTRLDPDQSNNSVTSTLPVVMRAPFGDVVSVAVGGFNSGAVQTDGSPS